MSEPEILERIAKAREFLDAAEDDPDDVWPEDVERAKKEIEALRVKLRELQTLPLPL